MIDDLAVILQFACRTVLTFKSAHGHSTLLGAAEQIVFYSSWVATISALLRVMYHRRSPFDHLHELRDALVDGGQLILETLVIDGFEGQVHSAAGVGTSEMGNVVYPQCATLCQWLRKMKFSDIQVADVSTTTTEEQRRTEWMTFHSLTDFLDPDDMTKTVEVTLRRKER